MFVFCSDISFRDFFVFVFCFDISCREMQCNRGAEMQECLCLVFLFFARVFSVCVLFRY